MVTELPSRSSVHWDGRRHTPATPLPSRRELRATAFAAGTSGGRHGATPAKAAAATLAGRGRMPGFSLAALTASTLAMAIVPQLGGTQVEAQTSPDVSTKPIRAISAPTRSQADAASRSGIRAAAMAADTHLVAAPAADEALTSASTALSAVDSFDASATVASAEQLAELDSATAVLAELVQRAQDAAGNTGAAGDSDVEQMSETLSSDNADSADHAAAADAVIAAAREALVQANATADAAEISDDDAFAAALTLAAARVDTITAEIAATVPVVATPAPMKPADVLAEQAAAALEAAPELAHFATSAARYGNGRLPNSELCTIPNTGGEKLRCDAAEQFARLNEAFKARFGHDIKVVDSYRSYQDQVRVKAARGFWAAVPGYSNHGLGVALDLGGDINDYGSAEYNWLWANARQFGWTNPAWARPGGSKFEPWHWEYTPLR